MGALAIINRMEAAIVATGSGLQPTDYRMPIELMSVAGAHRRFEVRLTAGRIARPYFGAGTAVVGATLTVRVSYARPGGTAGGGDRQSVNIQAGTDAVLIQDALKDPRNWDRLNTDIRMVVPQPGGGAVLVVDDRQREVRETRFDLEADFPWPT